MNENTPNLDRYVRQMRYPPIGREGQLKLLKSRALICGCGALGSVLANTLGRAGVGRLRIVDRDFLEMNNLQRQVLYDERDVASGAPKAVAAAARLKAINSEVDIEPLVADLDHANIFSLLQDVDIVLDGTDNFETRFLINDAAVKTGLPWVYGGCVGAEGQTMTILPGETPCFRCLMKDAPPPGATATCDSAGILGAIVNIVASLQAGEAIKILSGHREAISRTLTVIDVWDNQIRQLKLDSLKRSADCPACHHGEFPWLEGRRGSHSAILCGRNAVQLSHPERASISLESLARKLEGVGRVQRNAHLLRFEVDGFVITVFPDGRAIISGTEDIREARTLYAKYIGA